MNSFQLFLVPMVPSSSPDTRKVQPGYQRSYNPSRRTVSKILACSSSRKVDGPLCQYRRGFFDHLKPRAFVTNSIRVCTQQGTLVVANYMTEQLEQDLKRNELVKNGEITQEQADKQAEQWEKEEWEKRWTGFSQRLFTAFAKYHAVTLVMRTYEYIADKFYDNVTMDKLTMDTFRASLKLTSESDESSGKVARTMFHTTLWANTIAFMADYSVHQVILCYTYYRYVQQRRRNSNNQEEEEGFNGAIMSRLLKKSSQLMTSRSVGLFCSAVGGAMGTIVWPGWGTLLFSNLGEGAAGVIVDDGQSSLKKQ